MRRALGRRQQCFLGAVVRSWPENGLCVYMCACLCAHGHGTARTEMRLHKQVRVALPRALCSLLQSSARVQWGPSRQHGVTGRGLSFQDRLGCWRRELKSSWSGGPRRNPCPKRYCTLPWAPRRRVRSSSLQRGARLIIMTFLSSGRYYYPRSAGQTAEAGAGGG